MHNCSSSYKILWSKEKMKVGILVAYFIFTVTAVTGQDNFIPLVTTDCCFKKTVGGVSYTQVRGRTSTDGYGCKDACTYEQDGDPGSQYCFSNGQMEVQCLNSEDDFKGVPVTYSKKDDNSTDLISFNTDIGLITCTVDSVLPFVGPSKDIQCSLQSGESDSTTKMSREGPELLAETDVPFVTSKDDGHLKRFSLFSKHVFINCDIADDLLSSCTADPVNYYQYIYVEEAVPEDLNIVTWEKCRDLCNSNHPKYPCQFWTFSDLAGKEWGKDNDVESRNHAGISECGIRNTYPGGLIKTAPGQSCGLHGNQDRETDMVYVATHFYRTSPRGCQLKCYGLCTTWTFEYPNLCILNYGKPLRKINVCNYIQCRGRPVIVSGLNKN